VCWWRAAVGGSGEVIVPTRGGMPRSGAGPAAEEAGLDMAQGFGVSGGFERECCLKEGGRSLLPMPDDMGVGGGVHGAARRRVTGRGSCRRRVGRGEPGKEAVRDYARVLFLASREPPKMVTGGP
jgi:hypothetical protein